MCNHVQTMTILKPKLPQQKYLVAAMFCINYCQFGLKIVNFCGILVSLQLAFSDNYNVDYFEGLKNVPELLLLPLFFERNENSLT